MGSTDSEIFGKDDEARIVLKGRSRINARAREQAIKSSSNPKLILGEDS